MYAIVATGGKQYKVSPGEKVRVEKLEGSAGDKIVLENVLFISESQAVGTPYIEGASVETEITKQARAKKVIVYKYKPKKGYHKKNGHRQYYTELLIESITKDGEILAEYVPEEEAAEEEAGEAAEETAEDVTEEAAEETAEEAVEDITEEISEETVEDITEEISEETAEETAEEVSEETEEA